MAWSWMRVVTSSVMPHRPATRPAALARRRPGRGESGQGVVVGQRAVDDLDGEPRSGLGPDRRGRLGAVLDRGLLAGWVARVRVVVARVWPSGSSAQCAGSTTRWPRVLGAGMAAEFEGGAGGAVDRQPADDQLGGLEADLDPLPGPGRAAVRSAGGHRVGRPFEGDHRVPPDPAQVRLRDQQRMRRDRAERGVITGGAQADDLAVGAVDLTAPDRHPAAERLVELGQRGELAPGQDMLAGDEDLALHPALPGRAVGGEHVDLEPVVLRRTRRPGGAAAPPDGARHGGGRRSWCGRRRSWPAPRRSGRTRGGGSRRTSPGPGRG